MILNMSLTTNLNLTPMTMNSEDIFTKGIMFKKVASDRPKEEKVKTKAKKKAYITGQHHSASAKMKAEIRRKRANRHK